MKSVELVDFAARIRKILMGMVREMSVMKMMMMILFLMNRIIARLQKI